jgi:hypothetical protein
LHASRLSIRSGSLISSSGISTRLYTALWKAHEPFFTAATARHLGSPVLTEGDRRGVHLMWDVNAKSSA